ncbi:MAG: polysaccharide deacetylase family protein [Rubrivivax sp.]|nr:polysaccharide deacetylase family protein [Rubrivivax sp.]
MSVGQALLATAAGPIATLGGLAERATRPRLSVLIYHRVLRQADPLFPDEVDAARFDMHLRLLRRHFHVLPLGRALSLLNDGALPAGAVAITFDDGYADNAEVALPILQRHGLAATFFVATGFLDGGRMFNDSVIECLRHTRLQQVDLAEFGLGRLPLTTAAERRAAIDALLPRVKYLGLAEREHFLDQLHALTGRPALPGDLMMRSRQVVELHRAGMEIGGHTVHHPILRLLPEADAEREIRAGRERLQALTDAPVQVFAYPNGQPGKDYGEREVAIVRRLGFLGAVSTRRGTVTTASDRHQLPRFTPWDRAPGRWLARLVVTRLQGGSTDEPGVVQD